MYESKVIEDILLTSMMVEDAKKTLVRPKRRRMKALYFTCENEGFRPSVGKKNASKERKKNPMLSTIEETVKALSFDTITTMAMQGDEGANSKEHANDCILESEMNTGSKNTTNKR